MGWLELLLELRGAREKALKLPFETFVMFAGKVTILAGLTTPLLLVADPTQTILAPV
jgi:hypothetical protein